MEVRVCLGRLDNVHCRFGGGCARLSFWICVSLMMCTLLLCRFGSNVGAEVSLDGQLLLEFAELNGDYLGQCQGDFTSWNASDVTPCGWLRVFCTPDSAVHRLDLSGCSLGYPLELDYLAQLGSLQELDFSSNPGTTNTFLGPSYDRPVFPALTLLDVSGSWDNEGPGVAFSNFPSLQYLYAERGTQPQGGFPTTVTGLRDLVFLSLADSGLVGGIPDDVRNLTQLMSLDLSDNFLNGSIPNLERLTRLARISLTSNSFSGEAPAAPNLAFLDAGQNRFTDFSNSFFQMSALQRVNLSWNQLGGQLLDFTGLNFPSLQVLNLAWNCLHGQIPTTLPNLRELDLSHNNLSGPIPWDFSPPGGRVPWVDLSGNQLDGSIPPNLLAGPPQYVNLSENSLVGSIPDIRATIEYYEYYVVDTLDLSDNQLSGPLPSFFATVAFGFLWLQNNQLSGNLISLLSSVGGGTGHLPSYSVRLQGNRFTGDLTNLLDFKRYVGNGVLDLSYNNLTMMPSEKFPNPLQGMLEQVCNYSDFFYPPEELRLAGSDLMGIPLPDRLKCLNPMTLDSYRILDLASCNLGGTLPEALFNISMPGLTFLNLSNNKLSGPIPHSFQHPTLQVLDLSHNNLTGEIPGKLFFGLPNLRYLNVSGNKLRGPIPDGMPQALYNSSFFADNPGLCGAPLAPCKPPPPARQGVKVWVVVTVVVAAVLVCTASCLLLVWRWRVYSKKHQQDADLIATLLERETVTVMPLRELRKATSNFSESAQIGAGGFGTVYVGELADGTAVAIKKGKREGSPEYKKQFLNEVRILSGVSHRHLVKLLGCSMENKIALLVFEFVSNGTLQEHLQGTRQGFPPLSWRKRLLIALQTADALAYLHSAADPPIFHRDIKSCNILLDDDLNAKVADFGISKLAPSKAATHVSTMAIQGTMGYIDPEYYSSFQLTPKSDVYSFGVVLLELISSKPAIDFGRGADSTSLVTLALSAMDRGEWQELIDPALVPTHTSANGRASIAAVGALAVRCLAPRSRERPEMEEVRNELQTLWLQCDSDASFQSDSVQPQNAQGDVDTSCDHMSMLSSHSSVWNSSSTSYPEIEIEMQHR